MTERSCDNCKYEHLSAISMKCGLCRGHEHWEPNPKRKSKWHPYPEETPKDVTRAFWVWDNHPDPRMIKLHFYVRFDGNNFVTANGSTLGHVTHWRYMPKPPMEYR